MRSPVALAGPRTWAPSQWWGRAVVLLGPPSALLVAGVAGNGPAPWVVVVVTLLSASWAARPESGTGTLALLLVLFWWTRVPDDALHPGSLVAAAAVVACHVAAVVCAAAPPRTPLDPAVLRLWVLRGVLVLVPAPVLWVLGRALRDQAAPAGLWPAALLAALLVVVALGVVLEPDREAT